MKTDEPREPRQAAVAVDAGYGHGPGARSGDGATATVRVIPLWDRPRTGVRG
ncbi:hypothetical protein PV416_46375 [Streptomyces ipomoeae]|jgi:hypothetical protein|uniref:Uncharacterized protein n=1 Tax=Streptomyces ipomoeae 91-03 TaxID=698759 RepID=L1KTR8_9ACTN|nr:hypothetical protein [Streptomyces ipomoeae]EKX63835.1 hypothetical protein STRIP9103_06146 [Streptomyces ipomoeae 91-03]MDX2699699.1 hypothetical protein [Streptomyces ipomoeae]MDX2828286.1 hypothetical protein [Streptomyces ipomoeae]MDX2844223.1 hypothetical protein [Streptomyces ipomoeae]MDX2879893.1 hypothetical protein [Streptomyces ipomoeae]